MLLRFLLLFCLLHHARGFYDDDGWIGHRFSEKKDTLGFLYFPQHFGCQWRGTAPFCEGSCIEYEVQERRSANRTQEEGFGAECWTGQKAFCCILRNEKRDSTWRGYWRSAVTGDYFICSFIQSENETSCGIFVCSSSATKTMEFSEIHGSHCNEISLFGMKGAAYEELMFWEKEGIIVDRWYKGVVSDSTVKYSPPK